MRRFLTSAAAAAIVALGITLVATPAWAPKPDKTTLGKLGECAPDEVAVRDGDGDQTWRCDPGGAKYVFVASARHGGEFGVPAWDALCNADAAAAGLAGEYLAWLSTAAFDAGDTLLLGPFFTPDGVLVALTKADFLDAKLLNPIDTFADGTTAAGLTVWTGTQPDGTSSGFDCEREGVPWSAFMGAPFFGTSGVVDATDGDWTDERDVRCNDLKRAYCIQLR